MTLLSKFIWGFLAGLMLVFVKIIGPDKEYVNSLFQTASDVELFLSADILFYIFISGVTILLGAVSGLFAKEQEPAKLMIFCASVPALLSTFTAETRDIIPHDNSTALVENFTLKNIEKASSYHGIKTWFVGAAHAQSTQATPNSPVDHICNEPSLREQFAKSAANYLQGKKPNEQNYFAVVVASEKEYQSAKSIADSLLSKNSQWSVSVGCRRPGNDFYPVIIGEPTDKVTASELKGSVMETGILSTDPYLSFYEYRTPIYEAGGK